MISHEIIIVKPKYTYTAPGYSSHNRSPVPDIKSQADLDKWREGCGFNVGDYVTYRSMSLVGAGLDYAVLRILKIQDDYEKMTIKSYGLHNPELLQLTNMAGMERWDDVVGCRRISEAEWINVVKPHLDKLRNSSQSPA